MRLFFITLFLTYLLSACGLKGPLYLPPPADEANRTSSNEVEKK